jgi:hypothetical protein
MNGVQNVTVAQVAELDGLAESIMRKVGCYEGSLGNLIRRLEAVRPEEAKTCGVQQVTPLTLGNALTGINDRLTGLNDLLDRTIKRIEEQVGELKILP